MLVDFQSRPLSPMQETGVCAAGVLAVVSAVAFIVFQQLKLTPNLRQALTLSATACNLISTATITVGLLALSLKKTEKASEKQEEIEPPVDEGLGLEGLDDDDDDEPLPPAPKPPKPQPATQPALAPQAPVDQPAAPQPAPVAEPAAPAVNLEETLHEAFMDRAAEGFKATEGFIEALKKSKIKIDQEMINTAFPKLHQALKESTSLQAARKGRKIGVIQEVRHFFYVHGKKWQQQKFSYDGHIDDNIEHFDKRDLFKDENYSAVLKEALEQADMLHYPYLAAFKAFLKPDQITSEQALIDAVKHIQFNYEIYLKYAEKQFNRLVGLCFYVPGYVVMRQGFFMHAKVKKFKGFTTQAVLRSHEGTYGVTGWAITNGAGGADQLKKQIKERIETICRIQIKGRSPLFIGSDIEKHLKKLMISIYLPILQAVKGKATGDPTSYDSGAYTVTDVEGYGKKLTEYFKENKGGAWVPKEEYKALQNNPFAPLEGLDPIQKVKELADHLGGSS
jgi:hypothetical protein